MLLFGMINWMFTWFRPGEPLTHEQMGPMVADLFLGGLAAVNSPARARPAKPISPSPKKEISL
jgi:TetR/AcrR family transcriptional regulator